MLLMLQTTMPQRPMRAAETRTVMQLRFALREEEEEEEEEKRGRATTAARRHLTPNPN